MTEPLIQGADDLHLPSGERATIEVVTTSGTRETFEDTDTFLLLAVMKAGTPEMTVDFAAHASNQELAHLVGWLLARMHPEDANHAANFAQALALCMQDQEAVDAINACGTLEDICRTASTQAIRIIRERTEAAAARRRGNPRAN